MGDIASTSGKRARRWGPLKLILSLSLLGLILLFVDVRELIRIIAGVNPWYILSVMALIILDRGLMAYKWNPLLRALKVHVPFSALFRIYSVAPLMGMLLPATIGGDAFRVYSLSRYDVSARAVVVSIIVERLIGFAAMLVLAMISLLLATYLIGGVWSHVASIMWILLAGATILIGLTIIFRLARKKWIPKAAEKLLKYPLVGKIGALYTHFCEFRSHRREIAEASFWTSLEQLVPIATNFLLMRGLHMDVSLLDLVVIVPLMVLAIRMPISFEGFGVQEGIYVVLLALVGISPTEALLLSAVTRGVVLLSALPWGIHYLLVDQRKNATKLQPAGVQSG